MSSSGSALQVAVMREDHYWSHFANGTVEWQRAFNEIPPRAVNTPRAGEMHADGGAATTGLHREAVNVRDWLLQQRIRSCRSDHLRFVSRLHLLTSSSNNSHIYLPVLSSPCCSFDLLLFCLIFEIISQCFMDPPPLHCSTTSCFINPHYHKLSAASTTGSPSNVTDHFPNHKNLS